MFTGYAGRKGIHVYTTFGKFPKYMENPLKFNKRKPVDPNAL